MEKLYLNASLIILFCLILLFVVIYIYDLITKSFPKFRSATKYLFDRLYVFLIPIPVIYLIYYYSNVSNGNLSPNFFINPELAEVLQKLSIWFFSVGIFSSTLKYLNTLTILKQKFREIVLSNEFKETLEEKLEVLAYSDNTLKNHKNISEIWKKVTLFKLESQFPSIYEKLKLKVNNNYFRNDVTPFYYKYFTININVELMNESDVEITTSTRYTIVRPNEDEFEWTFYYNVLKEDYEKLLPFLELSINEGETIKFDKESSGSNIEENKDSFVVKFIHKFKGSREYNISTKRKIVQNLDKDRIISVGTHRIIDYLVLSVNCCDKLKYIFSSINQTKYIEEPISNENRKSFIHTGLLEPSELFKIFLIRKN